MLVSEGDFAAAERMMERARGVGLQAGWVVEGWLALERGDLAKARAQTLDMISMMGFGLPPGAGELIAGARVGDADARAGVLRMVDDYLVDPPARISVAIPWILVVIGEVDRGLTTFADHPTSNDAVFLGDFLGARLIPEVWTSPVLPEFLRKTGIAAYWDELGAPEQCRKADNGDYRCE
jgi:hypothetical protein